MYVNFFFLLVVVKLISDKEKFDKFVLEYMLKILINVCLWCWDEVVFMIKIGDVKWFKNLEKYKL